MKVSLATVILLALSSGAFAGTKIPVDAVTAFDWIKECYSEPLETRATCFNEHSVEIFIPAQKYGSHDQRSIRYVDPAPRGREKPVKWVRVSRPMISCAATEDSAALRQQLLDIYPQWLKDAGVSSTECHTLKVGGVYLLDDQQTEADQAVVVKLWEPVCPRGCSPTMTPVYAPPRIAVGSYLRPTKSPRGWD